MGIFTQLPVLMKPNVSDVVYAVSYTHLDVYKRQVDGYAIIAGDSYGAGDSNPAFYQVTGHVNIEEQALMTVDMGEAVQVQTCLLYTSRCV